VRFVIGGVRLCYSPRTAKFLSPPFADDVSYQTIFSILKRSLYYIIS